jgi:hypothetical protein
MSVVAGSGRQALRDTAADGGDVVSNSGSTGISRSSGSPVPDVPGRALDQFADKDDQQ